MASQVRGRVGWSLEVERARRCRWLVAWGDGCGASAIGDPDATDGISFTTAGIAVTNPPVSRSNAALGTRNRRPNSVTGRPSRPSVSRHLRARE